MKNHQRGINKIHLNRPTCIDILKLVFVGVLFYTAFMSLPIILIEDIRTWVYRNTVISGNIKWKADETYNKNIIWIYEYYRNARGGGKCNNISYFFRMILDYLGYISFEYHFGKIGGFNHVVNLVRVRQGSKYIFTVQDAYYNMSFYDKKNNLLDFFSMVDLIKMNRTDEIIIKSSAIPRGYLFSTSDIVNKQIAVKSHEIDKSTRMSIIPTIMDDMKLYFKMFLVPRGFYGSNIFIYVKKKHTYELILEKIKEFVREKSL